MRGEKLQTWFGFGVTAGLMLFMLGCPSAQRQPETILTRSDMEQLTNKYKLAFRTGEARCIPEVRERNVVERRMEFKRVPGNEQIVLGHFEKLKLELQQMVGAHSGQIQPVKFEPGHFTIAYHNHEKHVSGTIEGFVIPSPTDPRFKDIICVVKETYHSK